jgi:hypothetical protein
MNIMLFTLGLLMQAWPSDFVVKYNYVSGSVPPPYHYEYSVTIDAKCNGTISYKPDFVFDTLLTETFHLSKKNMRKFWSLLKKNDFFYAEWIQQQKLPVGGSTEYLEIIANNKTFKIPAFPVEKEKAEKILEVARNLFPKSVMDTLSAKREKFIEEFNQQKK